jgi:hypothetical protein
MKRLPPSRKITWQGLAAELSFLQIHPIGLKCPYVIQRVMNDAIATVLLHPGNLELKRRGRDGGHFLMNVLFSGEIIEGLTNCTFCILIITNLRLDRDPQRGFAGVNHFSLVDKQQYSCDSVLR